MTDHFCKKVYYPLQFLAQFQRLPVCRTFTATAVVGHHRTNTTIAVFCSVLGGLSGCCFLKKVKTAHHIHRAESHLNATSFDPIIWFRMNAAGVRERTAASWSRRNHPPSSAWCLLPHSQLHKSQTTALPGQYDYSGVGAPGRQPHSSSNFFILLHLLESVIL